MLENILPYWLSNPNDHSMLVKLIEIQSHEIRGNTLDRNYARSMHPSILSELMPLPRP